MSTKTFALSAGVPYPVHMSGEYFRILDSIGAVDVLFRSQNRALQDDVRGVLAGFALSLPAGKGFDYFELLSATSQSVQVFAGSSRVEYDRAAGSVSVTGTATVKHADATTKGNGPATIGITSTLVYNTSAGRQRTVFKSRASNIGRIWLHMGGAALVNEAIELAPGETYIEVEGAGMSVNAISEVAGSVLDWHGINA